MSPVDPSPDLSWRRLQFGLSYLIYVLTIFAIGFAVLGKTLSVQRIWPIAIVEMLCVAAFVAYFGIRVPILFHRWRRGVSNIASKQRELTELAEELRKKND